MSERELIEVLHARGEQRVRDLWREAEKEAERLRKEKTARIEKARRDISRQLGRFRDAQASDRLHQAREEARKIVLEAEHALTRRCRELAVDMFGLLDPAASENLLGKLAEEVPPAEWETVTVNPRDRKTAQDLFPGVTIETDGGIAAGFKITTAQGRITIDNTLEMRLQRAWPFLLPDLMGRLREKLDVHESAEKKAL